MNRNPPEPHNSHCALSPPLEFRIAIAWLVADLFVVPGALASWRPPCRVADAGLQRIDVLLDRRIDVESQMLALRRPSTQSCYKKRVTINGSHDQFIEQRLRLFQITRVEPFRKPPVNRSQQFASLLRLALVTPEAREAHGGAEFPGFGLLLARPI
jgi:hypothetical protein